jgi:uncharacterized protein (TIGR01777 family)
LKKVPVAKVIITGGSGLIGSAIAKRLMSNNHQVVIFTRGRTVSGPAGGLSYIHWNPEKNEIDRQAIADADYIFNLAGAGIAGKRWTDRRKKELTDSRVKSTSLICATIAENPQKLKALISASATGWYGTDPVSPNPVPFKEDAPHAPDFLGELCYQWEQSLQPLRTLGKRVVILRTGIVLSPTGGALEEFIRPLRVGVKTLMGGGQQVISWIHLEDLVGLYLAAMEQESFSGIYNAVSPNPVTQKDLMDKLARAAGKKTFAALRIPAFVLKMALGEISSELLKSTTVSCEKVTRTGFEFNWPEISRALENLMRETLGTRY